ncbi:hypothetical protein niasHT_025910 [Heterodera trifolii]|uniref:Uncharacterized protein n=1 Tax=Heterodera trifolii TaxID=157864 RepID=A0ABD2JVG9_9BILA
MAQKVHIDSLYECPVNVLGAVASGERGGVFVIAVSDVWESSGGGEGMEEDESICRSDGVRIRRNDQITPPTN